MPHPLIGIMPVIKDQITALRRHNCLIMPVIEAQRASILVPHDHRHINHERELGARQRRSDRPFRRGSDRYPGGPGCRPDRRISRGAYRGLSHVE